MKKTKKYKLYQRIIQVILVSTLLIWLIYFFIIGIKKLIELF